MGLLKRMVPFGAELLRDSQLAGPEKNHHQKDRMPVGIRSWISIWVCLVLVVAAVEGGLIGAVIATLAGLGLIARA
jgi:hypothetical protein